MTTHESESSPRRARWPWIIAASVVALIVVSLIVVALTRPDNPTTPDSSITPAVSSSTGSNTTGAERDQVQITGQIGSAVSAVDGVTPRGFPAHCIGAVQAATIAESILNPSLPLEPSVYDGLVNELSGGIGGASVIEHVGMRQTALDVAGTALDVVPYLAEGFWRMQACDAGNTATIDLVMVSTNIETGLVQLRTSQIGLLWYDRDWHVQTRGDAEHTPMDDFRDDDESAVTLVKADDGYRWTVNGIVVEVPIQDEVRAYFLSFEGWRGYVR